MQGAGTIAHLVHQLYPERQMHGWELDPVVVSLAQQHMGLQQLQDTGCLVSSSAQQTALGLFLCWRNANCPFLCASGGASSSLLCVYVHVMINASVLCPCVCFAPVQVAHVGDALSDTAAVEGGAAGIIVDLFADGQLIPQLTHVRLWMCVCILLCPFLRMHHCCVPVC